MKHMDSRGAACGQCLAKVHSDEVNVSQVGRRSYVLTQQQD